MGLIERFLNVPTRKELERDLQESRTYISKLNYELGASGFREKALKNQVSIQEEEIAVLKTALLQLSCNDKFLIIRNHDDAEKVSMSYDTEMKAYKIRINGGNYEKECFYGEEKNT